MKDEDDRRTETIAFRVTPAECLHVAQSALEAGMTASEYARRRALGGKVVVRPSRTLAPAVFDELRRIGVNLNQLARVANATGRVPRRLEQVCAALEDILVREIARPRDEQRPAPRAPELSEGPHGPSVSRSAERVGRPPERSDGP